jgi:hypothetical protein
VKYIEADASVMFHDSELTSTLDKAFWYTDAAKTAVGLLMPKINEASREGKKFKVEECRIVVTFSPGHAHAVFHAPEEGA